MFLLACCTVNPGIVFAETAPDFKDYPAEAIIQARPVAPDRASETWARLTPSHRAMVLDSVEGGANFAGAFALVELGCGTGCQSIVVVDLRDGTIHFAPRSATLGTSFRIDSRLLIYNEDTWSETPPAFFVLEAEGFRELDQVRRSVRGG